MIQVNLEEAKNQLSDLINAALQGEKVVIEKDDSRRIQMVPFYESRPKPQFGCAKGLIEMADDFDDPIEDFHEYM